jgi:hypothetical protein
MSMQDSLPGMLHNGEILNEAISSQSRRLVFAPEARIDHHNIEKAWPSTIEHFAIGYTIGSRRAASWSLIRRLAYIAGSVLVPAVLLIRNWKPIRALGARHAIPALALPALLLLLAAKAAGEAFAYAGIPFASCEETRTKYEIRRFDYASPCLPR